MQQSQLSFPDTVIVSMVLTQQAHVMYNYPLPYPACTGHSAASHPGHTPTYIINTDCGPHADI